MTLERKIAAAFNMSEDAWARHANPWSGWTRIATALPLLILAIWSRVWLGWRSLIPVAIAVLWIWLNHRVSVPQHHLVPDILNAVSALGAVFIIWGLIVLNVWSTLLGFTLVTLGKLWYFDRMVWLYQDM